MRRMVVEPLVLAFVLAGVSIGRGQQASPRTEPAAVKDKDKAPPAKSKLEEMLAEALKNNPDIRVAAAKVAEADAELNRMRLQVTQKVVALYYAIDTQKKAVEFQETKVNRLKFVPVPVEEMAEAQQALTLAKAKLAELESQMPALLGKAAHASDADATRAAAVRALEWLAQQQRTDLGYYLAAQALVVKAQDQRRVQGPLAERMRQALQTPVKVDYKDVELSDVLNLLQKKVPGLSFQGIGKGPATPKVTLQFEEALPVSAILQALADYTGLTFVVREYGILVTMPKAAPPGAMTVEEFLRKQPANPTKPAEAKNAPAEQVEGEIKKVDAGGLVVISIGSDAGLAKGHTLEVFRLDPMPSKSKYLGTIRILDVKANEAVGQPVGRMADTLKVGDKVASRVFGK